MAYYLKQLKDPRWQKKRLLILQRDNYTCQLCGDTETTLNINHKSYSGQPWEVDDSELETLCEHCHLLVTYYQKNYDYPVHILRISKKKSFGSFLILLIYRNSRSGENVIDIFSINKKDENSELVLETIFSEQDTNTFIDFINSIPQ